MRISIISLAALASAFYCTSLFAEETAISKKLYIKAQAGSGEIQNLGSIEITSPKASLKIMCEDESGRNVSTFILPNAGQDPEAE
ncbi:MAG: hypothetical protein ABH843_05805 [Candidatus Omnitrophota bacterium]